MYPDWVEDRSGDDIPDWAEDRWGDDDDDDDDFRVVSEAELNELKAKGLWTLS